MPKAGLLAVVLVWAFVLYRSISVNMLWEDEAFNLTVVRNLVEGLGYTSDGMLSGNDLAPFDTRISTGPVILLPAALLHLLGIDLVLSGRLVTAAFAVALGLSLYFLAARIHHGWQKSVGSLPMNREVSWVGLVAALTPLAYDTRLTISPIQGPADVLGEFAAAACLAWALYWLHRRPWLAGLLVGLAVQSKFIALLAVPAFALGALLQADRSWARRVRDVIAAALCAALPTVLYELWVLLTLGWNGYRRHLHDFRVFLQGGYQESHSAVQKAELFLNAWFLPSGVMLVILILLVLFGVALLMIRSRSVLWQGDERTQITVTALSGLVFFLGWWMLSSQTPLWVRHPAVGMLAFVPVLIALVLVGGLSQVVSLSQLRRKAGAALCACLTVLVIVQVSLYLRGITTFGDYTLGDQRREAAEISVALGDVGLAADDTIGVQWGGAVSVSLMTRHHLANLDGPEQTTETLYRVLAVQSADLCAAPPMVTTDHFIVCSPRDRSH